MIQSDESPNVKLLGQLAIQRFTGFSLLLGLAFLIAWVNKPDDDTNTRSATPRTHEKDQSLEIRSPIETSPAQELIAAPALAEVQEKIEEPLQTIDWATVLDKYVAPGIVVTVGAGEQLLDESKKCISIDGNPLYYDSVVKDSRLLMTHYKLEGSELGYQCFDIVKCDGVPADHMVGIVEVKRRFFYLIVLEAAESHCAFSPVREDLSMYVAGK